MLTNSDNDSGNIFGLDGPEWEQLLADIPQDLFHDFETSSQLPTESNGLDLATEEFLIYLCCNPLVLRASDHLKHLRSCLASKSFNDDISRLTNWGQTLYTEKNKVRIDDQLRERVTHFALKLRLSSLVNVILNCSEYLKNKAVDAKCQAIKDILSSRVSGAVKGLQQLQREDGRLWLVWYVQSAPTDEGTRQAIKDILSTRCSEAIKKLQQLQREDGRLWLVWYVQSAPTDEGTRQAIKDILSTRCSEAIKKLQQLQREDGRLWLVWYVQSAPTDEGTRQAIKDILSTNYSEVIKKLQRLERGEQPLLSWYIDTAQDTRQAIKDILSTRCSEAINILFEKLTLLPMLLPMPKKEEVSSDKDINILLSIFKSRLSIDLKKKFLTKLNHYSKEFRLTLQAAVKKQNKWPKRHVVIKNFILNFGGANDCHPTTSHDASHPGSAYNKSSFFHTNANTRKRKSSLVIEAGDAKKVPTLRVNTRF